MKENSTKTESADAPEDSARAKAWEKAYDSLSPEERELSAITRGHDREDRNQ